LLEPEIDIKLTQIKMFTFPCPTSWHQNSWHR